MEQRNRGTDSCKEHNVRSLIIKERTIQNALIRMANDTPRTYSVASMVALFKNANEKYNHTQWHRRLSSNTSSSQLKRQGQGTVRISRFVQHTDTPTTHSANQEMTSEKQQKLKDSTHLLVTVSKQSMPNVHTKRGDPQSYYMGTLIDIDQNVENLIGYGCFEISRAVSRLYDVSNGENTIIPMNLVAQSIVYTQLICVARRGDVIEGVIGLDSLCRVILTSLMLAYKLVIGNDASGGERGEYAAEFDSVAHHYLQQLLFVVHESLSDRYIPLPVKYEQQQLFKMEIDILKTQNYTPGRLVLHEIGYFNIRSCNKCSDSCLIGASHVVVNVRSAMYQQIEMHRTRDTDPTGASTVDRYPVVVVT